MRLFQTRSMAQASLWGKGNVHSSLGAIAFLQRAPKKSSASKMEGFPSNPRDIARIVSKYNVGIKDQTMTETRALLFPESQILMCVYIYIYIFFFFSKDLIWWADFRLQDVEKQRVRRKTKAKKGRKMKKKKLGNMKNPHVFVGVCLGQF